MNDQDIIDQIARLSERLDRINFEQQEAITEIQGLLRNQANYIQEVVHGSVIEEHQETDRDGIVLREGQRVRLLTVGAFRGNTGEIVKIGKSKVTIKLDRTGRTTTRNFANVRIIQDA
jgi:transcription antitermination factor NusG